MKEISYYQKNKDKYKNYYQSVDDKRPKVPIVIKTGVFTLSFD